MGDIRLTGFVSNLDTERLISDMMRVEQMKVDKVKAKRQISLWRQEGFREIIGMTHKLQSTYFDVLKPQNNLGSLSAFSSFTYDVRANGKETSAVSVTARADIMQKNMTIDRVQQLATKDTWTGNSSDLRTLKTGELNLSDVVTALDGSDLELMIAVDGTYKKIAVSNADVQNASDVQALAGLLDAKVVEEFGADFTGMVSHDGNRLTMNFAGAEIKAFQFTDNEASLEALGLKNGQSNLDYRNQTIKELFGLNQSDLNTFEINGEAIALNENMTIQAMTRAINQSQAGVTLAYNALNDQFVMHANNEGTANDINIKDGSTAETVLGKLFGHADLVDASGQVTGIDRQAAKNALLTVNGVDIVKSNNSFQIEKMNITLNAVSTDPIEIQVKTDAEPMMEKIKGFIEEYNELIETINEKYSEKRNTKYGPLSDEQRDQMSEEEIEKWEKKAKEGMLRGSYELDNMVSKLRSAFIDPIEGVSISMKDLGIGSLNYEEKGKLTLDETKFKTAVANRYEEVVQLFTKSSDIPYREESQVLRERRYKESGIADRLDGIMKDYTRTTRNSEGIKGILVNKAGVKNDVSAVENEYSKEIKSYDKRINTLIRRLASKEAAYYAKFSRLETALSQMESQSNSLFGMLGQGM